MSSTKKKDDIMKLDLYKLLNVNENATPKQIKKAYRIKALDCHPDKNPDNPKAAELFHQLSEALKILSDVGARAAYDHLRKAKKAAQERNDKLGAQRKKVKMDLEARERLAEQTERKNKDAKTTLLQEVERLRDEGSRILEEEQRKMREQMKEEKRLAESARNSNASAPAQLKVKWRKSKDDSSQADYNEEILKRMFSKFGEVTALILSKKKKRTAIVEFRDRNAARLAAEMELGNPKNPLEIAWISGKPEPNSSNGGTTKLFQTQGGDSQLFHTNSPSTSNSSAPSHDDDFEAAVLNRLKREQERRRALAEDLQKEETG